MKKILGSLLFLTLSLFAKSQYEWKIELSKSEIYMHEATTLKMQCTFEKEGKHDDVEFVPPSELPFEFKLLFEDKKIENERQIITYKYLIFAKKAGEYDLVLKPKMLFMTQSAIYNVIIGRDNVNDLETVKEIATIEALKINVKATSSDLSGEMSIKSEIDSKQVSAYEPVHMEVSISGSGNLDDLKPIVFAIEGVEVFSDIPEQDFQMNENGYTGKWTQSFAFVSKKDFTIPTVEVKYFDINTKEEKILKTDAFDVKIKTDGIKREELIDKVNLPSQQIDFSSYLQYIYYLLTFISGFIVAKLFKLPARTQEMQKGDRIKKAKTHKELLEVLISCEKNLFTQEIEKLEKAVYKKETVHISDIKKEALSKL